MLLCCPALPDRFWVISQLILHGFCSNIHCWKALIEPRNPTWSSDGILAWSLYREALNGASPRYSLMRSVSSFVRTKNLFRIPSMKSQSCAAVVRVVRPFVAGGGMNERMFPRPRLNCHYSTWRARLSANGCERLASPLQFTIGKAACTSECLT